MDKLSKNRGKRLDFLERNRQIWEDVQDLLYPDPYDRRDRPYRTMPYFKKVGEKYRLAGHTVKEIYKHPYGRGVDPIDCPLRMLVTNDMEGWIDYHRKWLYSGKNWPLTIYDHDMECLVEVVASGLKNKRIDKILKDLEARINEYKKAALPFAKQIEDILTI